jgi:hypothetical protein
MQRMAAVLLFILATVCLSASAQMGHLQNAETIAKIKLSPPELKQIVSAVEATAFDAPDSWEKELRARRISLRAVPGLVLQGTDLLCGATENCQLFVFRRAGKNWAPLFAGEQAPLVEGFSFGPEARQGIKDLHVIANSSAEKRTHATYRFDGKFYRAVNK